MLCQRFLLVALGFRYPVRVTLLFGCDECLRRNPEAIRANTTYRSDGPDSKLLLLYILLYLLLYLLSIYVRSVSWTPSTVCIYSTAVGLLLL